MLASVYVLDCVDANTKETTDTMIAERLWYVSNNRYDK